jgi:hypothetical protein
MHLHRKRGSTLGIVAACALFMILLGVFLFSLMRMMGGSRQMANASDAGAIGAARQLVSITADISQISTWNGSEPYELEGLSVDGNGNPVIDPTNSSYYAYNIFAYNRAAGAALLVAMNAAVENTTASNTNATQVIQNLQLIGDALYSKLASSCQLPAEDTANTLSFAFQTVADGNDNNMLSNKFTTGADNKQHTTALVSDLTPGYVGGIAGTQVGKANIYFNSGTLTTDYTTMVSNLVDSTGVKSPTTSYNGSESNDAFVYGYKSLVVAPTNAANWTALPPVFAIAVNPVQFPHLIDLGRFNTETTDPSATNATTHHLPFNSLLGQTNATAKNHNTSLLAAAVACATIGANNYTYPVSIPRGYVRIQNDYDTVYNSGGTIASVEDAGQLNQGQSLFNKELYQGTGGGGGIVSYASANATGGYVFGTEDSTFPSQMSEWILYYGTTGTDTYGHDGTKDPTGGIFGSLAPVSGNIYSSNPWQVNNDAREQFLPDPGMNGQQNIYQAPAADMYAAAASTPTLCTDASYQSSPPTVCENSVYTWNVSYGRGGNQQNNYPAGEGSNTGGLTNLEYVKGEVITAYQAILRQQYNIRYTFALGDPAYPSPPAPSGSRLYSRGQPYADPTNSSTTTPPTQNGTLEFGQIPTAWSLLQQIQSSSNTNTAPTAANCPASIDVSGASTAWTTNVSGSVQYGLYQRLRQIDPSLTAATAETTMQTLLSAKQLDLGSIMYIYMDPTTGHLTSKLSTDTGLPSYLSGTALPDGNLSTCFDNPWDPLAGGNVNDLTVVDASAGAGPSNNDSNIQGDCNLNNAPFTGISTQTGNTTMPNTFTVSEPNLSGPNASANVQLKDPNSTSSFLMMSSDGVLWLPSSGKGGFLGELLFQNVATSADPSNPPVFDKPN